MIRHLRQSTCWFPAPKKAIGLAPLTYHYPGTDSLPFPVIVIRPHASRQTYAAALLLKTRLDTLFVRHYGRDHKSRVIITSSLTDQVIENGGLIFNLGNKHVSGNGHSLAALQGRTQGYIIQPDSLAPNLVHLIGSDPEGDFYAAVTVAQLLDDSLFVYHQSSIIDYPDIPERSFLISAVSASSDDVARAGRMDDMLMLKLNRGYLDYCRSRSMWEDTGTAYLEGLSELGMEAGKHGMIKLAQMVNPYAFLPQATRLDSIDPGLNE